MKKSLAACSWCSCSILSSTSASWDRARDRAVLSSEFPNMAILLANTAVFPHSSGERKQKTYSDHLFHAKRRSSWTVLFCFLSWNIWTKNWANKDKLRRVDVAHPSCDWPGSQPKHEASSAAAPRSPPPGTCPQTTARRTGQYQEKTQPHHVYNGRPVYLAIITSQAVTIPQYTMIKYITITHIINPLTTSIISVQTIKCPFYLTLAISLSFKTITSFSNDKKSSCSATVHTNYKIV